MLLEVGRVVKPHGLRGDVLVDLSTNRAERLAEGSRLITDLGVLRVRRAGPHRGRWIVSFEGVGDLKAAEELRGAVLRAEPVEDDDAMWVHELIGSEVLDPRGGRIGRVEAVEANPASDLLVLESGALVPLRFVVRRDSGRLVATLPDGLLGEGGRPG